MREVIDLAAALVVLGSDVTKTFRGEDFKDDGTIAAEDHRKWNEMAQHTVDPVKRSVEERHKLPASTNNDRREGKEFITARASRAGASQEHRM